MVANGLLLDVSIVIVVATMFAYFAKLFKQPMVPAYIFAGVIIGPILGLITDKTSIAFMSEFGIALMLFIVGLEMNLDRLKHVFRVATLGGTIRSMIFFTSGFIIAMLLGFIRIEAIYIGIFLAFSSTMVVVKQLADKKQMDTLHGRIIVGILLMEDVLAIIALSIFSTHTFSLLAVMISLLKVAILFLIAILGSKFILPKLFKFAAKHMEILLLVSVSVLMFFIASSLYMGELFANLLSFLPETILVFIRPELSIIIGAFIAGVMLGNLPYYIEIIGRVNPLKDFFATMFFVSLGMELVWLKSIIIHLVVLTLFILIAKPIVTLFICGFFGYKKRPSFLTAVSLPQISEFSLIIAAQGFLLAHISQQVFSIAIIVAVFTMVLSTYSINYEEKIYKILQKRLDWVDKLAGDTSDLEYMPKTKKRVILCGHNRIGYSILRTLNDMKKSIVVVDYNPETIKDLIRKKIPCLYGDISEVETLERLDMKEAEMIISTIADLQNNLLILRKAKDMKSKAKLFMTAIEIEDALKLYDAGADYVILPHFLGGEHASALIKDFDKNINGMIKTKLTHIKELKHRHSLGHKHPKHKGHRK
jgi:Kef-type K+ transport system membrane component KefB